MLSQPRNIYDMSNKIGVGRVKYPQQREELLLMLKQDQDELRNMRNVLAGMNSDKERKARGLEIFRRCHIRANRMLDILDEIRDPTIDNIGEDGSEAVAVLSLHSYLSIMKKILSMFEKQFEKDPATIHYQSIPALADRVMLLEQRKQLFGNNWFVNANGKMYLAEVDDFANMNSRRAKYGLAPRRRPIDLSYSTKNKYPLGKGLARESDQQALTADSKEYKEFQGLYLKSLISRQESKKLWQRMT